MSDLQLFGENDSRHQNLKSLFHENENAHRVHAALQESVADVLAAKQAGITCEARGIAVLGRSGAGKTASVLRALSEMGFDRTGVGDAERPFLVVRLSANATLRAVCADCLMEIGWRPKKIDSAQSLWADVRHYMKELKTFILVLDEIQHVRSAGQSDKAALRDFLKSLVQPSQNTIIPVVVGMGEFREVLVSDDQLRRRFDQVIMRDLEPIVDLAKPIKTLIFYAENCGLTLGESVLTRDFAARLMHASNYAFGEMCALCVAGIKRTIVGEQTSIEICHFADAFQRRSDCVPALNPFLAADFQNIQATDFHQSA